LSKSLNKFDKDVLKEEMNSESVKTLTVDVALIITLLTGFSYLISFLFYAGEFTYYKIPWFLIDINISNIIYTVLILSPYVFLFTWDTVRTLRKPKIIKQEITQTDDTLSRKSKKKKTSKFKRLLILFLLILTICIAIYYNKNFLFGVSLGFITTYSISYSIDLYKKRNFAYLTIIFCIVTSAYSYGIGYTLASEEKTHIVVKEKNETYVGLTVYKEQFVVAPLTIKTKEYSGVFKLIEIKDVKSFQRLKVGKIKLKQ
jgi:hypothetical protein